MMAERLKLADVLPDLIISSTAKRALQTAKGIAKGLGYELDAIEWREELYHCIPSVFEEVISTVDDRINTLFVVAHNPSISEFAAALDDTRSIHDMPTCAIAAFKTEIDRWTDFSIAKKELVFYDTPKKDHE
jgi:phosphohistidine phosphatase